MDARRYFRAGVDSTGLYYYGPEVARTETMQNVYEYIENFNHSNLAAICSVKPLSKPEEKETRKDMRQKIYLSELKHILAENRYRRV